MHSKLGLLFMIVGAIGCAVALLCIPALWVGRAYAIDQVNAVATQVRTPLQQANDATTTLATRFDTLSTSVSQLGSSGPVEQRLATGLLAVIDENVTPAFDRLRTAYLQVRERLIAAMDLMDALRRLAPGIPLPTLPADALANLDAQLQTLNDRLQQMRANLAAGNLPDATPGLSAVQNTLDQINTSLDSLHMGILNLQARIQQIQVQVDEAEAMIDRALTGLALALSLVCVYVGLLHVALFAYGRGLRRPALSATPQPLAPPLEPIAEPATSTP